MMKHKVDIGTIETPFNEQEEWDYDQEYYEPIVIEMPNSFYGYDPVQQRMMIVLAMVALGVLLFAGLAMPRIRSASVALPTGSTTAAMAAERDAIADVDVPTAAKCKQ